MSKSQKQLNSKHIAYYISLWCQNGITNTPKDTIYEHVYKSKYSPKSKECCQFRVNISLCKTTNPWCIHHTKGAKKAIHAMHNGHFKLSPAHIHTQISMMPSNEIELARQCNQLNLTNSALAELVSIRNALGIGNTWNRHQIHYLNKKSTKLEELEPDASSAEKLIATFDNRDDCSYLYVTYKPSEWLVIMTCKMNHIFDFLLKLCFMI